MPSFSIPNRNTVFRAVDAINAFLEDHFFLCGSLFVVQFLAYAVATDIRAKMWVDELYTLAVSQQRGWGEIIKATLEGCDGAPPIYAMIAHSIRPWVWSDALSVRLPTTLGYCGMLICLLVFCRRRLPAAHSLIAAFLACSAGLGYATEGRGYGIVLGCAAGALLCWQTATDGLARRVSIPLLAFCLALMTATHYYSIFFTLPILLAEIVRWRTSGKLDHAVLAAMIPALLVIGLHYPIIAAGQQFEAHPWSRVTWGDIPSTYSRLFLTLCLVPLSVLALLSTVPSTRRPLRSGLTVPEWVAVVAFLPMPALVVILSKYTTHMFVDRYTLWAITGIAILVAAFLYWSARGKAVVGVTTLCLLAGLVTARELNGLRKAPVLSEAEGIRKELAVLTDHSQPIVVADHHVFMELSYYAPPQIRERLIYPLSRDLDLRYFDVDSGALLMSALRRRTNLQIVDYATLLATYPHFILAALPRDYLPWHLVAAGYSVVPIRSSVAPALYMVEAPHMVEAPRGK